MTELAKKAVAALESIAKALHRIADVLEKEKLG